MTRRHTLRNIWIGHEQTAIVFPASHEIAKPVDVFSDGSDRGSRTTLAPH